MPEDLESAAKSFDFFSTVALRASTELREELNVDEDSFRHYGVLSQPSAKDYFLYSILDEVTAVGIAIMRWGEMLGEGSEPDEADDGPLERVAAEMFAREGALWHRRLVEALAYLLCFRETDDEAFYRHFLLRSEATKRLFQMKDQKAFFACESRNLQRGADRVLNEIRRTEASIDFPKCWYAPSGSALGAKQPHPSQLLVTFAAVLSRAVRVASEAERMELGVSYEQFSLSSGLIHFSPGHCDLPSVEQVIRNSLVRVATLSLSILQRVMELIGVVPEGACAQLKRNAEANKLPDELGRLLTNGRGVVGDFVVVGRALARIDAVNHSEYGYESYAVTFIADAPVADITKDCVLPRQVLKLFEASRLEECVRELLGKDHPMISENLAEAAKNAWNLGLRKAVLGK